MAAVGNGGGAGGEGDGERPEERSPAWRGDPTPEVTEIIARQLRLGNYLSTAAALAGVTTETIRAWCRRGARARSGPYRAFAERILKASAEFESQMVGSAAIAAAGQRGTLRNADGTPQLDKEGNPIIGWIISPDWRAALRLLEVRFPDKYGRRDPSQRKSAALVAQETDDPIAIEEALEGEDFRRAQYRMAAKYLEREELRRQGRWIEANALVIDESLLPAEARDVGDE